MNKNYFNKINKYLFNKMNDKTKKLIFKLLLANNILIIISLIFLLFFVCNKNYVFIARPKQKKLLFV